MIAQVVAWIEQAIASGALRPGDSLPTVRQLSVALRIDSNAVARAYMRLEHAGLLEYRRGRGMFVREQPPKEVYR
jgi:GntR family transcriptional regulator